jgi:hypothetical protein
MDNKSTRETKPYAEWLLWHLLLGARYLKVKHIQATYGIDMLQTSRAISHAKASEVWSNSQLELLQNSCHQAEEAIRAYRAVIFCLQPKRFLNGVLSISQLAESIAPDSSLAHGNTSLSST